MENIELNAEVVAAANLETAAVTAEQAEVELAKEAGTLKKQGTALHMPRPTVIGSAIGTLAATGLELLSDTGSMISAATALTVGGFITGTMHVALGNPADDGELIKDALKKIGNTPAVITGLTTFAVSASAGRIAASYFPGSKKEEVVVAEENEVVTF